MVNFEPVAQLTTYTKITPCHNRPIIRVCHQLLPRRFINNASKEGGKQGQSPPPASLGEQQGEREGD